MSTLNKGDGVLTMAVVERGKQFLTDQDRGLVSREVVPHEGGGGVTINETWDLRSPHCPYVSAPVTLPPLLEIYTERCELISAEHQHADGDIRAVIRIEVFGPGETKPPSWAVDKAIAHADSVVEALAPSLKTIVDLLRLTGG